MSEIKKVERKRGQAPVDAAGVVTILFEEVVPLGFRWEIERIIIKNTAAGAVPPDFALYASAVSFGDMLEYAPDGSFASADETHPVIVLEGEQLIAQWKGCALLDAIGNPTMGYIALQVAITPERG